ncbi:MAG: REP-associated tyrosine transposase [Chitinophagales bacterium]
MSQRYKFGDPEGVYFTTSTIVQWIDLFTRYDYCYLLIDSLKYCVKEKGLMVHAFCIMPSHLHMIISRSQDEKFVRLSKRPTLSDIMRDFKKFTSKQITKTIPLIPESRRDWLFNAFEKAGRYQNRIDKYKVWQDGNHPILLNDAKKLKQRIRYLHNNPVASRIVNEAEHYVFSSASNYVDKGGVMEVDVIDIW